MEQSAATGSFRDMVRLTVRAPDGSGYVSVRKATSQRAFRQRYRDEINQLGILEDLFLSSFGRTTADLEHIRELIIADAEGRVTVRARPTGQVCGNCAWYSPSAADRREGICRKKTEGPLKMPKYVKLKKKGCTGFVSAEFANNFLSRGVYKTKPDEEEKL